MLHETLSIFVLGTISGITVCSFSCLPFLGPFLLSTGQGFKDGVSSTALFIIGKIAAYTVLGCLAGLLGQVLAFESSGAMRFILGVPLIITGLSLPFIHKAGCGKCHGRSISFFGLGLITSLVPCPALTAVFALAAKDGSILNGALYGLSFGSGLIISPLLIIGGGLSVISSKIKLEAARIMPAIQVISCIIMVLLGTRILFTEA
ncbi:MAG: sulfite exporter TauE/SafE family protein [Proteobacteria bacterium]|nr:sulfite exporter TauE/SafE family protein [Pseudomonadota bacterium]MBU1710453.1 sulfite exporter TauE/SafE family protein [Pseudomonadota bacterium]